MALAMKPANTEALEAGVAAWTVDATPGGSVRLAAPSSRVVVKRLRPVVLNRCGV